MNHPVKRDPVIMISLKITKKGLTAKGMRNA